MDTSDEILTAIRPCPKCGSRDVRRSSERGIEERLEILVGVQRVRCRKCGYRYREHPWHWPTLLYTRCPKCANLRLRDWQEKYYLPPVYKRIFTYAGGREQRCEPCRHNFVSLRPRMRFRKELGRGPAESNGNPESQESDHGSNSGEKKNGSK